MTIGRRNRAAATLMALACLAALATPLQAQVPFSHLDKSIELQMGSGGFNSVLPNQKQVRANIDTRIAQLRSQVSIAFSRGWLKPRQSARLNNQLNMIQAMQTRASAVGLTVGETRDLLARLRTVSSNLNQEIANTGKFERHGRGDMTAVNLENQRLYLQSRINQGVRLGRLDSREVRILRGQLDQISRDEMQAGGLSGQEQMGLQRRMAELGRQIERFM